MPGVGVGHVTVNHGEDIHTGVTAIVPRQGNIFQKKVAAAADVFNGFGKTVGLSQIRFEGVIETPILLTETLNTFLAADALIDYCIETYDKDLVSVNPVVGETNGSFLTKNHRRVITEEHVFQAISLAAAESGMGAVQEGNVGAGTPSSGYGFKGGIGTASREISGAFVGALVQLNCGRKQDLRVAGVPIGRMIEMPHSPGEPPPGSIMILVATDLALESRHLWKMAKRGALGLARTGSYGSNGSGDFCIAFSTGGVAPADGGPGCSRAVGDAFLSPFLEATVESVEEAILNALFAAETMTGRDGHIRYAIPIDQVRAYLELEGSIRRNADTR